MDRAIAWVRATLSALSELVLPVECAGCGALAAGSGLCAGCVPAWAPGPARPEPAPEGLPPCVSAAVYDGPVRGLVLAYKERGRRALARPLGAALAGAVAAGAGPRGAWPLLLVPVPDTAAAARARYGDHMLRLAHAAADRLRADGWQVRVLSPIRALPKADSAHLDRAARARAATAAFAIRPRRAAAARSAGDDAIVVVLDDVLTTGATVAAVTRELHRAGVSVAFAATVAATRLRSSSRSGNFLR